jgi:hypothetical protein
MSWSFKPSTVKAIDHELGLEANDHELELKAIDC